MGWFVYALAWASFGAGHSLLALEGPKAWLGARLGRGMRLGWNAIATVHLGLVLWVGHAVVPAVSLELPRWWAFVQGAMVGGGFAVWLGCARSYDLGRLAGIAQLRGVVADDEPFRADGVLAWVRHPLYSGAILVLGGLVNDTLGLATFVLATGYIVIGYHFEERGLRRRLGPVYDAYRAAVPALVPWRGRVSFRA